MESSQNRIINKQTETLTKMDSELTDMALKMDAMDEGVKTGFSRVDKDLEALDGRVNRRCKDNDLVAEKLQITEGKIEVLEERSRTQRDMIEKLITHVESMEDCLCRCHEGKGKGKAVEILSSPVLGSPLVLDRPLAGSDGSYHTPPVALSPVVSSSSSGSDKENICHDFHIFTYFLLSSKRPNTCSNHDMALSYLILSYLFTFQSHTIKTRKADSIGIPTKNYLLGRSSHDPLVLLIRLP